VEPNQNADAALEIGIAIGLEKPVFVIATDSLLLGNVLSQFPSIVGANLDKETLAFHLQLFVDNLKQSRAAVYVQRKAPRKPSTSQLHGLHSVRALAFESILEQRVAEMLINAGGYVVTQPRFTDSSHRPDMLVWFSEYLAQMKP
jgi:hypothetical protein